jgi:hypothetical protein
MFREPLGRVMLWSLIALTMNDINTNETMRSVMRSNLTVRVIASAVFLMRMRIHDIHMIIAVMPHHTVIADACGGNARYARYRPFANTN